LAATAQPAEDQRARQEVPNLANFAARCEEMPIFKKTPLLEAMG